MATISLSLSPSSSLPPSSLPSQYVSLNLGGSGWSRTKHLLEGPQTRSGFKQQENATKAGSSKEKLEIRGAIQSQQLHTCGVDFGAIRFWESFQEIQEQLQQHGSSFQQQIAKHQQEVAILQQEVNSSMTKYLPKLWLG